MLLLRLCKTSHGTDDNILREQHASDATIGLRNEQSSRMLVKVAHQRYGYSSPACNETTVQIHCASQVTKAAPPIAGDEVSTLGLVGKQAFRYSTVETCAPSTSVRLASNIIKWHMDRAEDVRWPPPKVRCR